MLWAILNKSWRQHSTKHQLYGHLPPITKTIQVRQHSWRSRNKLISDVCLWTPSHGWAKAGQPARTYIQQLCADTGCSPEDLLEAMDDRKGSGISMLMVRHYDDDDFIKIIWIFYWVMCYVKCRQFPLGFEIGLPCSFSTQS